ncbi:hypothetical protein GUT183_06690 [Streptococcus ruminantium]|nr:hypothetical protein GUT183_06690 [Streptococcus ruminantium]
MSLGIGKIFTDYWRNIRAELFSKEEILASDARVAKMSQRSESVYNLKLYDEVIDKVTGQNAIIVYISDELADDCYLIEPLNHSYLPDWREINQLIRYKKSLGQKDFQF